MDQKIPSHLGNQFGQYQLAQHFLNRRIEEKTKREFSQRLLSELKDRPKGKILEVPRVPISDPLIQTKSYRKQRRPFIIEGAAEQFKCMQTWTPEYFKQHFGDTMVPLINPEASKIENMGSEQAKLGDVIDLAIKGDPSKYARFVNLFKLYPQLYQDIDKDWYMGQRRWRSAGSYFNLFIGAGGTKTNLHGACSHNLFTQVYGQKHWTIISPEFDPIIRPLIARTPYFMTELDPDNPDLQRYPEFEYIDRYQCVLKEGDILYNPASWWHKVSNLSTSIGFGFRWFDPIDSILISKTLTLQFLGSTNPSLLQYISFGKNNFTNILTSSKS